jgi:peptide/nickel transport system ATP-binding protein
MAEGQINSQPVLRAEKLTKRFGQRGFRDAADEVTAFEDVSLSLFAGKTLALVGESGSGKSTVAMCLACLERPTSGSIWFEERNLATLEERELRKVRPQVQVVFQDPASSMNPRLAIGEIVSEPLMIQGRLQREEIRARVLALLERVGLQSETVARKPAELSGGQKQRVAIARAMALEPKVLILDEALSALDCSVQAQIANLLIDLQASEGLAYLFITHDLAMAENLADEVAVMDGGRVVECGPVGALLRSPAHDATRNLVAAAARYRLATPLASVR